MTTGIRMRVYQDDAQIAPIFSDDVNAMAAWPTHRQSLGGILHDLIPQKVVDLFGYEHFEALLLLFHHRGAGAA